MSAVTDPPQTSGPLAKARSFARGAQSVVFYLVSCLLGLAGLGLAVVGLLVLADGELAGLAMMGVSLLPISLPIVVFRERRRDRKLRRFLIENVARLGEGAVGPGGVTYTLDTALVYYQTRLSALLVALKFDSGLYLHGPSHRLPKALYTLFTVLFGWWVVDLAVWGDNLVIISDNLSDSNRVTVGELLGLEPPATDSTAPDGPRSAGAASS